MHNHTRLYLLLFESIHFSWCARHHFPLYWRSLHFILLSHNHKAHDTIEQASRSSRFTPLLQIQNEETRTGKSNTRNRLWNNMCVMCLNLYVSVRWCLCMLCLEAVNRLDSNQTNVSCLLSSWCHVHLATNIIIILFDFSILLCLHLI